MNDFNTTYGSASREMDMGLNAGLRGFMLGVYNKLALGIAVSGVIAYIAGSVAPISAVIFSSPIMWIVMFAPVALILASNFMMRNPSPTGSAILYWAIVVALGLSMGVYFFMAKLGLGGITHFVITKAFLATAATFAGLSLYGYTTKKDLSGMGTFLMMGVIGLIVAMVINIFLQSPAMMFAISAIGVLIFAGLTAYHTQDIKNTYVAHAVHGDQEWLDKAAIDGALSLYISFLNMFQFLLMFMGQQE